MNREEKILNVLNTGLDVYPPHYLIEGQEEAAAAISQLFDEERDQFAIEFLVWKDKNYINSKGEYYHKGNFEKTKKHRLSTAELLQLFKNRPSPDNQ